MKKWVVVVVILILILSMTSVGFASGEVTVASALPSESAAPSTEPTDIDYDMVINGGYIGYGMDHTYGQGYTPTIADNMANVVLPLNGPDTMKTSDGPIYCTLSLGGDGGPFVISNYDNIPVGQEFADVPNFFVARFAIPLKADRKNGSYPLGVNVRYTVDGEEYSKDFSINVNISDGKVESEASEDPQTTSQPKVIMSNYEVSADPVKAGETFSVEVTLENTSKQESVKNLTVSYKSQTTDLMPEGGASTSYIESISSDSKKTFTFEMEARADAKSGPQKIDIAIAYEDSKGTSYTAQDEITIQIRQEIRLDYDAPTLPEVVYVGDSTSTSLNLYNKGKNTLYNVTVVLDVPGLVPDSSSFLGNLESGASKTADIYASVSGAGGELVYDAMDSPASGARDISSGGSMTGPVEGKFLVTYEDEFGDFYELEIPLNTTIEEDVIDYYYYDEEMMPEEESFSFPMWLIFAIVGGVAVVIIIVAVKKSKAKREKELMEDFSDDDIL